jgi:hypothetical protein
MKHKGHKHRKHGYGQCFVCEQCLLQQAPFRVCSVDEPSRVRYLCGGCLAKWETAVRRAGAEKKYGVMCV